MSSPKPTQTTQPGQPQPTTQPKPPRQTLALNRHLKNGTFHFSGTSSVGAPAGFSVEPTGGLGKLLAEPEPNAKPLYACRINNSEDHMTSPSSTCEGQTVLGTLGYIFTQKPSDTPSLPLYRCLFNGTHFDSIHANCEGYKLEWQFGWTVQ
ncbi:hypothetical protein FXN61_17170 [Lentzea sp. PSKA42]|uniref:Uncharacterized protein n=1 Tax=Lentzea indica TaxID=2604800 RepID=A0ABX1FHK9_9PSEU|nr:hypothetical protein [Lentzea indica]NKE58458.1 hypothetical protein [Lentzea indica]